MINGSNAYLENRVNQRHITTLLSQISHVLQNFKTTSPNNKESASSNSTSFAEVILNDGSHNLLSLNPGIYHITGGIGSGKTTLINMLLDYEREERFFKNTHLTQLKASLNQDNIRVIERDAVIFNCFNDIHHQINGPFNVVNDSWKIQIEAALKWLLRPDLVGKWMSIFMTLVSEYTQRKNKTMSSGEKIILSMMRFFASWDNNVNLLVIDECDSFLDYDKKILFVETITSLASHLAIYICSHDAHFKKIQHCSKINP
jgi:ABC-type lipoprotein export system ATPase subunit